MKNVAGVVGITLGLFGAGCGQAGAGEDGRVAEGASYLVIDRAAREAGVGLVGVSERDAILPIELASSSHPELRGPAGVVALDAKPGEVVYVRGADARVDRGALDVDVARDRVALVGAEAAAHALASEIGGVVDARDGRFVVVGPEALAGLARAAMPDGLDEVVPVLPDDGAGRPAFAGALGGELGAVERGLVRGAPAAAQGFDLAAFERERLALPPDQLLPSVVDCPDPVAGTWVSREHYPTYGDWYRFELHVRRDARDPNRLVGTIASRSWDGGPATHLPDRCAAPEGDAPGSLFDWTVRMAATGELTGDTFSFGGRSLAVDGTRCGPRFAGEHYALDQFTGTLVDGGRYLRAFNNDGGRSVDDPHLFRRVSCQ